MRRALARAIATLPALSAFAVVTLAVVPGLHAQADSARADTARRLGDIVVVGVPPIGPVGTLPDVRGTFVFSGKKTEVLRLDSLTGNTTQNVMRELLARVPGANVAETEAAGFPSNGFGVRGLNPVQSVEMNVRQDGVNIAADLYGYPETYYQPPMEAVERVELVRGSSGLQFGPQIGGAVNYILRDGAPGMRPVVRLGQGAASFGTFTSFASVTGGTSRWGYTAYAQGRTQDGWRPNADVRQLSLFGRARYAASDRVSVALEYTLFRNRIQMPGGLSDAQFAQDPRASYRSRNWLESPWNVLATRVDARLGDATRLSSVTSLNVSARNLVWRSEDGGPGAPDLPDPLTGQYVPRELEKESFTNLANETRLLTAWSGLGGTHSLVTGVRLFAGWMHKLEGEGTTGTGFDQTLVGDWAADIRYRTLNAALFAENVFRLGERLSLTPGLRLELLRSTVRGTDEGDLADDGRNRAFLLAGLGAQYRLGRTGELYGNVSQSYRPIEYSFLAPFGGVSRVSRNLRDPRGVNADLGWRGTLRGVVTWDVSAFLLLYRDRIGLVSGTDPDGTVYTERRNVADSRHAGVEAYLGVRPFGDRAWGALDLYNSFAYVDARYTSGEFDGKRAEYAPRVVNRAGVTWSRRAVRTTLQATHVARQFGDANNTLSSPDAVVGLVPAYDVLDWSARVGVGRYALSGGVNNLLDERYFTRRTDEYPGPGILPGQGRSVWLGVSATF